LGDTRMSTLGRLQSGAAGTMQKMSSLWGGKSGYTETSFLDDDLGRPESLDAVQKTSPKQPEAAKPTQREANEPWNQAATVRAQLEEELKREGVSRSSPQQQNLNVRSRTQSTESANQIPKSPVLDSADPLGGDRSRKRTNTDKRIKKDRDKKGSPDSIWAVPNDGFGEADRTDSPIGIGNPWTWRPRSQRWRSHRISGTSHRPTTPLHGRRKSRFLLLCHLRRCSRLRQQKLLRLPSQMGLLRQRPYHGEAKAMTAIQSILRDRQRERTLRPRKVMRCPPRRRPSRLRSSLWWALLTKRYSQLWWHCRSRRLLAFCGGWEQGGLPKWR